MGTRISATQWLCLKNKFNDDVKAMPPIEINVGDSAFKAFIKNRKKKLGISKNGDIYNPISDMLSWCETNLNGSFYVEKKTPANRLANISDIIVFYFFDEDDSIYFALTWK